MPFFFFDPTMIFLIPAILLMIWAQTAVNGAFSKYSKVRSTTNFTGATLAKFLMDSAGIYDIGIEKIPGNLSDHFDPRSKVVRLSTYDSNSVAALGVAAHEIGHVIQHHEHYFPLVIRNAIVPVANIGSNLGWLLALVGLLFYTPNLILAGIWLYLAAVAFTLITLPVELDASRRAIKLLEVNVSMPEDELYGVKKVLRAAAMTYVATVLASIGNLLRLIFLYNMVDER
jgi:Zn-dependent membrane protease YugP